MPMNKAVAGVPWYSRVLREYIQTNAGQLTITALVLLIAAIAGQLLYFGHGFEWTTVTPFSPLPWMRNVFSAITFLTLGWLLYHALFYKSLYFVMVRVMRLSYRDYVAVKEGVWACLMYASYKLQIIVVHWLNEVASFAYNGVLFIVSLWPSFGIALLAVALLVLVGVLIRPHR